jgi:hypothetical protein
MRFKHILMHSIRHNRSINIWRNYSQLLTLIIGTIGYCLPVWDVASIGLHFNTFDLAEWTTLHPSVQFTAIPLIPSLALRIGVIGFVLLLHLTILSLGISKQVYWLSAGFAGIAMLPPLEVLGQMSLDLNYKQQLSVTLATWVGLSICYFFSRGKKKWTFKVILVVTAVSYIIGIITSRQLFIESHVPAETGMGLYVVIASIACLSLINRVEDVFLPYPYL